MNLDERIEEAIKTAWLRGMDWATAEDFRELGGDERDEAYLKYQTNSVRLGTEAIKQLIHDVIEEVKPERVLYEVNMVAHYSRPAHMSHERLKEVLLAEGESKGFNDAIDEMERKAKEMGL